MNGSAGSESDNDWLIDDASEDELPGQETAQAWRILIVDDDVDVHVVTKFSLSNTSFLGRRLSFLHAYSAAEALALLRSTPDVALVLLDVIMETNDAGLALSRQIRGELNNHLVRIVLRTGQPGQALEHSIIVDYDINDFWCKTDLTTRKLFTTVIASLRSYASLVAADRQIAELTTALAAGGRIAAALEQHTLLLTVEGDSQIADASAALCAHLGVERDALLGKKLASMAQGRAQYPLDCVQKALDSGRGWSGDLLLNDADATGHGFRATIIPLSAAGVLPARALAILVANRHLKPAAGQGTAPPTPN